jgi:hypothetical protein
MNVQFASLLGAMLVAVVTVWVSERTHTRVERRRLATALYAEMATLSEYFHETVGRPLEEWTEGQPLRLAPATYENLFPVYNANLDKLGLFAPQVAMLLVRVHVEAREHLESLRRAAEILQHNPSQHTIDELGHRLQRELAQTRETHERVARMLRQYAPQLPQSMSWARG